MPQTSASSAAPPCYCWCCCGVSTSNPLGLDTASLPLAGTGGRSSSTEVKTTEGITVQTFLKIVVSDTVILNDKNVVLNHR